MNRVTALIYGTAAVLGFLLATLAALTILLVLLL